MNTDDFVSWAMSPERTVEERFGVERAIEWGTVLERQQRGDPNHENWARKREIQNARRLNPAYEPKLNADEVRRGDIGLRTRNSYPNVSHQDRPMRDIGWIRFFPHF